MCFGWGTVKCAPQIGTRHCQYISRSVSEISIKIKIAKIRHHKYNILIDQRLFARVHGGKWEKQSKEKNNHSDKYGRENVEQYALSTRKKAFTPKFTRVPEYFSGVNILFSSCWSWLGATYRSAFSLVVISKSQLFRIVEILVFLKSQRS